MEIKKKKNNINLKTINSFTSISQFSWTLGVREEFREVSATIFVYMKSFMSPETWANHIELCILHVLKMAYIFRHTDEQVRCLPLYINCSTNRLIIKSVLHILYWLKVCKFKCGSVASYFSTPIAGPLRLYMRCVEILIQRGYKGKLIFRGCP